MCVSFMDLLEELDFSDPFPIVGDDVLVFDTRGGVSVLEVAIGVYSKSFITSHPYSGVVVSVTRSIIGRPVVCREEERQCCPGSDALY
jgi:hypothetical protein